MFAEKQMAKIALIVSLTFTGVGKSESSATPCYDYYAKGCPLAVAGVLVACGVCAADPTKAACGACMLTLWAAGDPVYNCMANAKKCGESYPVHDERSPPTVCIGLGGDPTKCTNCCITLNEQMCKYIRNGCMTGSTHEDGYIHCGNAYDNCMLKPPNANCVKYCKESDGTLNTPAPSAIKPTTNTIAPNNPTP